MDCSIKDVISARVENYKEVVNKVYKDRTIEGRNVKKKFTEGVDPIRQRCEKYKEKQMKSNVLAQKHNESFSGREEVILHRKMFPKQCNISFDMNVAPNKREYQFHIKTKPEVHNVESQRICEKRKKKGINEDAIKKNMNEDIRAAGKESGSVVNVNVSIIYVYNVI